MKSAVTRELFTYWNTLRGARAFPACGEIDWAALRGILASSFIIDNGWKSFPFRFSGTRLDALFAESLKGRSFLHAWGGPEHSRITEIISAICEEAAPVVAGVSGAPPPRKPPIGLELLMLPLRSIGNKRALLGSLVPTRLQDWLYQTPVTRLSLDSLRFRSDNWERRNSSSRDLFRTIPKSHCLGATCHVRLYVYDGGASKMME